MDELELQIRTWCDEAGLRVGELPAAGDVFACSISGLGPDEAEYEVRRPTALFGRLVCRNTFTPAADGVAPDELEAVVAAARAAVPNRGVPVGCDVSASGTPTVELRADLHLDGADRRTLMAALEQMRNVRMAIDVGLALFIALDRQLQQDLEEVQALVEAEQERVAVPQHAGYPACPGCDAAVTAGQGFCTWCGHRLGGAG